MKRPGIVSTLVLALALAGCDEDAASPAPARSKVEVLQPLVERASAALDRAPRGS